MPLPSCLKSVSPHRAQRALTSLMLLERYAAYRNLGKQRLADLISRCFDRACFAVPEVACVPPEEWDNVINGLLALAEPVVQRQDLDANLFATHVENARGQDAPADRQSRRGFSLR